MLQRSNQKTIFTLYQESDIQIKEEKHDGVFFKVQMRAQFESDRKGNHKVYLYEKSIAQLAKANQLGLKEMKKIILAHEFFHYLEERRAMIKFMITLHRLKAQKF